MTDSATPRSDGLAPVLERQNDALWEAVNFLTSDDVWDDLPEWAQNWFHRWRDRYDAATTSAAHTSDCSAPDGGS